MGYTTDFKGRFDVTPVMKQEHIAYINQFAGTRRMRRDAKVVAGLPDPVRNSAGLPIGVEGEFFVGAGGLAGQAEDESVRDYNRPPARAPGLWCQWVATEDGSHLEWDGGEKFYCYVEWLEYVCENFLKRWGYKLNGNVQWQGEEVGDCGVLEAEDNRITARDLR